jgi:hypothetical protein
MRTTIITELAIFFKTHQLWDSHDAGCLLQTHAFGTNVYTTLEYWRIRINLNRSGSAPFDPRGQAFPKIRNRNIGGHSATVFSKEIPISHGKPVYNKRIWGGGGTGRRRGLKILRW